MENYNQKIVGFVFNLKESQNIAKLIKELITFFRKFETDDKAYIYNSSGVSFEKRSQAVAELSKYKFKDSLSFGELLRDAISALEFESPLEKVLFVFNDANFDSYQVPKMIKIARKADCKVYFFEINRKANIEESEVISSFEGLSSHLYDLYKGGTI